MPPPARILEYFAELAPAGRGPRWNHAPAEGDLVSIPWPWEVASEEGGALVVETNAAGLGHLWSAARIHGSPGFLRLGWIFISGTCEIERRVTKVFVPVASVPVRLRRDPGARSEDAYQVVADADLAVPDSLFPDHTTRHRLNMQLDVLTGEALLRNAAGDAWEHLQPLVDEFCEEAGLPRTDNVLPAASPVAPTGGSLSIHTGMAVYTARDRTAINLESTLRVWARENLNRSALFELYADGPDGAAPDVDGAVANSLPLNRAQEEAILMARDLPISVLSGPPGTGKTHTAVALAIDQIAHGNSVLIAAQSDDAVDAVESLLARYSSPRHVRFGSRSSRKTIAAELSEGLEVDPAVARPAALRDLEEIEAELVRMKHAVRRRLEMEDGFARAIATRVQNSWCLADAPGLDRVVSSRELSDQVRTLYERRDGTGGGLIAPMRRARAARRLASILEVPPSRLDDLNDSVLALIDAEEAVRAGQVVSSHDIDAAFDALEESERKAQVVFGKQLEETRAGRTWAPGAARAVSLLATALRSGQAARRSTLQKIEIRAALGALPLWIGTLADIDDVLPMRPAMFDVVVIDEASQVNQVRAATALARGRRAVVIGDPQQLRHVSFVGDEKMRAAADRSGLRDWLPLLDVRRNSLFDVAAGKTPVVQLTEHYRSAPHLINFSSRHFYGDRLRLMTEHPSTSQRDVIDVVQVASRRDESGVVAEEAELILGLVADRAAAGLQSVGVVTPFRAQADAIERLALDRFSPDEIEFLDLRIGTVHGFQGNERDHVFVSLAVDQSDLGPLRFVEDPNLFNVMVTRARTGLTLVMSVDPAELPEGLLLSYIRHAAAGPAGPVSPLCRGDGWSSVVAAALRPFGLPVWEDYPVGGYTIDIVIGEGTEAIGVECGIHPEGVDAHMARHSALRRAGWEMMAAMESRYLARPEDAAQAIIRKVVQRGSTVGQTLPNEPGGQ